MCLNQVTGESMYTFYSEKRTIFPRIRFSLDLVKAVTISKHWEQQLKVRKLKKNCSFKSRNTIQGSQLQWHAFFSQCKENTVSRTRHFRGLNRMKVSNTGLQLNNVPRIHSSFFPAFSQNSFRCLRKICARECFWLKALE